MVPQVVLACHMLAAVGGAAAAAARTGGCTPKLCPSTKGTPPVSITMFVTSRSLSRPPSRSTETTLPWKGGCFPARCETQTRPAVPAAVRLCRAWWKLLPCDACLQQVSTLAVRAGYLCCGSTLCVVEVWHCCRACSYCHG